MNVFCLLVGRIISPASLRVVGHRLLCRSERFGPPSARGARNSSADRDWLAYAEVAFLGVRNNLGDLATHSANFYIDGLQTAERIRLQPLVLSIEATSRSLKAQELEPLIGGDSSLCTPVLCTSACPSGRPQEWGRFSRTD